MEFSPLRHVNLASAITLLGVTFGLGSIFLAANGAMVLACTSLFLAIGCDHFDGPVARRLNQSTEFGAQLDSLADASSFCLAPALISWLLGFQGLLAAIILCAFVLAGLLRLAMYNVAGLDESAGSPRFVGLPTTNAAAWWLIVSAVLVVAGANSALTNSVWSLFFGVCAVLMVSSIRIPKRGWYVRAHLVLVPFAVIIIWMAA